MHFGVSPHIPILSLLLANVFIQSVMQQANQEKGQSKQLRVVRYSSWADFQRVLVSSCIRQE